MGWNNPLSSTPWPQVVFFSYYLTDTNRENGCLRAVPGSHINHHPLHDMLPNAHEPEIQSLNNLDSPVFRNVPEAVDIPMAAGDLIIGDARLLHSAWPNTTGQRRTLLLAWHNVFDPKKPPSWWTEPVPEVIRSAWAAPKKQRYKMTRTANVPWRPRAADYQPKWADGYLAIAEVARAAVGRAAPPAAKL